MNNKRSLPFWHQIVIVGIAVFNLIISFALVFAVTVTDTADENSRLDASLSNPEANPDEDTWARFVLSRAVFFVDIVALVLLFRSLVQQQPFLWPIIAQVLAVIASTANLSDPSSIAFSFAIVLICSHSVLLIVLCIEDWSFGSIRSVDFRLVTRQHTLVQDLTQFGVEMEETARHELSPEKEKLKDWLQLRAARQLLYDEKQQGVRFMRLVGIFFLLLMTVTVIWEFVQLVRVQDPLYGPVSASAMNSHKPLSDLFPARSPSNLKVLLVVVDGLRYDFLERNAAMKQFLADIDSDSKILQMTAQLPTMSVPNWLTLLTGAKPESTGVLGNILIPETKYSNVFHRGASVEMMRGLTGSPWFADIVRSQVPPLFGDGTVPYDYMANTREQAITSDVADDHRGEIALDALNSTIEYPFFLAHFSDVDTQGHCCGVSQEWNKENTYDGAVTNKTRLIQQLVEKLDTDTVMFIVSDHGHVGRGGHGGVEPVLRKVPLVVYRKGSGLKSDTVDAAHRFRPNPLTESVTYSSVDVAPTITALLGLPAPAQAEGVFIDDVLSFLQPSEFNKLVEALVLQKQLLVSKFLNLVDASSKSRAVVVNASLAAGSTASENVAHVKELMKLYEHARSDELDSRVARNVGVATVSVLVMLLVAFYTLQRYTFADPSLLYCYCRRKNDADAQHCVQNFKALLFAFCGVTFYYFISIMGYLTMFSSYGYGFEDWDSTVIHKPKMIPIFLGFVFGPCIFAIYVLLLIHRAVMVRFTFTFRDLFLTPRVDVFKKFVLNVYWFFIDSSKATLRNVQMFYLYKQYLMWVSCGCLVLFIVEGTWAFFVPGVWQVSFITTMNWELRFRVLVVMLISIPLLATAVIQLQTGGRCSQLTDDLDPLYFLKIRKDLRAFGGRLPVDEIERDVVTFLKRAERLLVPETVRNLQKIEVELTHEWRSEYDEEKLEAGQMDSDGE